MRGKMEERTARVEEEEKRICKLVVAAETNKELANWCIVEQGNLNTLDLVKENRKEWPRRHKVRSRQVRQSRLCQKKKEMSHLFRSRDREIGESQGEREPHFGKVEVDQSGSMDSKVKEDGFQAGEERQAKITFLGEVGATMSG